MICTRCQSIALNIVKLFRDAELIKSECLCNDCKDISIAKLESLLSHMSDHDYKIEVELIQ